MHSHACECDFRRFLLMCMLIAQLWILTTFICWLVVILVSQLQNFVLDAYVIGMACLLIALFIVMLMVILASQPPLVGKILSIIVAVLVLFGSLSCVAQFRLFVFLISFAAAELLTVVVIIIALFCQCDFTVYIIYLLILIIVAAMASFVFLMAYFGNGSNELVLLQLCLMAFLIVTILLIMIFTAQALQGGYFIEVEQYSYIKSGCCFYVEFVVFFIMLLGFFGILQRQYYRVDTDESFTI